MEFSIFIILALIIFCYLSYRHIVWGLAAVIVLLPSYLWRFNIWFLPTTFLELMILSLFIIWLLKGKKYKELNFSWRARSQNKVTIVLRACLILWLLISLLAWALNPTYAALGLWRAYFLEPMMFFLVFIYSVNDRQDFKLVIKALSGLIVWLFILTIIQLVTNWNLPAAYNLPNVKRLTAVFSYPNALSLLTAPIAGLFFGLWWQFKKSWWYLLIFVLSFVLSWLAQSAGALVAIVLALVVRLILVKKFYKYQILFITFVLIIFFGLLGGTNKLNSLKQQLIAPQLDLTATSLEIRSSQWQETWQLLQHNWFLGTGLNGYQKAVAKYHQTEWLEVYLYPHNIFLNFWTELGLLGLLVFLFLLFYIIYCLRNLFQNNNQLAWPLSLMWLVWLIHGLVDVPYFKNDLSVLFFVMLSFTFLISKYNVILQEK